MRDGSSSRAATSKRRGHCSAAQARPAATPSRVAACSTPSRVRRQSNSVPSTTSSSCSTYEVGSRAQQDPHGLRYVVLGALRGHLAGHRLAEPPHLEQLGEIGGARGPYGEQRHAAGEGQQVGRVDDHGVGGVHDDHLAVHHGPQLVRQGHLFGFEVGQGTVEGVELRSGDLAVGVGEPVEEFGGAAGLVQEGGHGRTDAQRPQDLLVVETGGVGGVVQAVQEGSPPSARRPAGRRPSRTGGRAATRPCTAGRSRACRPGGGSVPAG